MPKFPCPPALAVAVGLLLSTPGPVSMAQTVSPSWTIQAIVETPVVTDMAVSRDGDFVLVATRQADIVSDSRVSRLARTDLHSGATVSLASASWISAVRRIPGTNDFSLLMDRGGGVQLYRATAEGGIEPLVVSDTSERIGSASEGPVPFGVSDYGWSKDGASLWFERRRSASDRHVVNPRYLPLNDQFASGTIELWVRDPSGVETLVDVAEASTMGLGEVHWQDDRLVYWIRDPRTWAFSVRAWKPGDTRPKTLEQLGEMAVPPVSLKGPRGGELEVTGYGDGRRLVEVTPDGRKLVFPGAADFVLNHPGSNGVFSTSDGLSLVAFARRGIASFGLLRLTKAGKASAVPAQGALSHCSADERVTILACVEEGMALAPRLVTLNPHRGAPRVLQALAPSQAAIAPLKVQARQWTSRHGAVLAGYIFYPRAYRPGQRYPTIVVTHGGDADNQFVSQGFQWDYPIQVLAERGFVVVALNEPWHGQSKALADANEEWTAPGTLSREQFQDLQWIQVAQGMEDVVRDLAKEGLVDPDRVGIAGYSRGSQIVNVAMTQVSAFKVASSGDGGYLEPGGYYFGNASSYRQIYGGAPIDPGAWAAYQRLSPTFRAAQAAGPILQQVARGNIGQLELQVALQDAGKPSELSVYPDESHLFHRPANRLAAMRENIAWFEFWLLGQESNDLATEETYGRWRALRTSHSGIGR